MCQGTRSYIQPQTLQTWWQFLRQAPQSTTAHTRSGQPEKQMICHEWPEWPVDQWLMESLSILWISDDICGSTFWPFLQFLTYLSSSNPRFLAASCRGRLSERSERPRHPSCKWSKPGGMADASCSTAACPKWQRKKSKFSTFAKALGVTKPCVSPELFNFRALPSKFMIVGKWVGPSWWSRAFHGPFLLPVIAFRMNHSLASHWTSDTHSSNLSCAGKPFHCCTAHNRFMILFALLPRCVLTVSFRSIRSSSIFLKSARICESCKLWSVTDRGAGAASPGSCTHPCTC